MAKILIIEDDPSISRLYFSIFAQKGYEVDVAKDGEEGLLKVKNSPPTLILLDIMMPKMNGMEVLDHLKSDAMTKAIPVVVVTNLASDKDAETALEKGALQYITKSDYDPQQLVAMVEKILTG